MKGIAIELGAMVVIGLLAALAGPFGTFAQPLATRIAQWLLFIVGGYAFFRPVLAGGEALAGRSRVPRLLAIACACLLATLPTTLLVAWALSGMRLGRVTVGDLAALFPDVLLVGAAITALQLALHRARPEQSAEPPPHVAPSRPEPSPDLSCAPSVEQPASASFLARLPPHLGRDLLALENEDHYVRAHTAQGSTLLLMRMRDAVAELADVEGLRTHRGWWVARAAVAGVIRRDRAIALRLTNGLEVPVARNEAPALRAAGWL